MMKGCLKEKGPFMSPQITLPKLLSSLFYHEDNVNGFSMPFESRCEKHRLRYLG